MASTSDILLIASFAVAAEGALAFSFYNCEINRERAAVGHCSATVMRTATDMLLR
jgi:hypothetical protein